MRDSDVLFKEEQQFRQPWIWALIFVCVAPLWYFVIRLVLMSSPPPGRTPPKAVIFIMWLFLGVGLPVLFYYMKLITEVRKDALYVRFFPLHFKFIKVEYNDLETFNPRKYNPIMEYGGWGIRYGFKNGKAYNVSGNMGMQLVFKDGKKLLIGTQQPEKFNTALKSAAEFKE